MHVLMTVNASWNIWNFRRPLVEALMADGHRITVLAPPDEAVPDLERLGCRFIPLNMSVKGLNPLQDFRLQLRLARHFRQERPDVVLSFTIKNNIFGARAAKSLGIPFIPNVTGLGTAFLSGKILQTVTESLYRPSFAKLPVVFFQNEDDRTLFVERKLIRPDQAALLPGSGIDLQRFPLTMMPGDGEPTVFLMIARLLRDKGVLEFVDAARQVKARFPQARFQLLGAIGAENRAAIDRQTVESWVKDGFVEYLGTQPDVRPAIAAASCVVLPSYREGAPRTLIEAAAMGRPLITADVPGCRSVVNEDLSGFLCEVRSADSLARAMERFLNLPMAMRAKMGAAGRVKMEREFDQSLVIAAYRKAIEMVVSVTKRPPNDPSDIRHTG